MLENWFSVLTSENLTLIFVTVAKQLNIFLAYQTSWGHFGLMVENWTKLNFQTGKLSHAHKLRLNHKLTEICLALYDKLYQLS